MTSVYPIAALGSTEFVEPYPAAAGLIPYDQLFELKTSLVYEKPVLCTDQQIDCYKIYVMYFVPINLV
jgi:hypothetical protein